MNKEQLIEDAIAQIKEDINNGDTTAIAELLNNLSENDLKSFLPER